MDNSYLFFHNQYQGTKIFKAIYSFNIKIYLALNILITPLLVFMGLLYKYIFYNFCGKNTVTLVPMSFLLRTLKYPLWLSTNHFAMDNPIHVPPFFLTLRYWLSKC